MAGVSIPTPGSSAGRVRKGGRARRRKKAAFGLQITSLMDILIIIVIFLLKSYGLSSMSIANPDKLQLPVSKTTEAFGEGIVVIVNREQILVDELPVLQFKPDPNEAAIAQAQASGQEGPSPSFELPDGVIDQSGARGILPIYDVLARKKEEFDTLASRSPDPEEAKKKWTGELFLQADKNVNYELLRQVMYTAGMAGYKTFRLTVEKQADE